MIQRLDCVGTQIHFFRMFQIVQSCLVQSRDVALIILMGNDPTRHRNVDPTVNAKLLDSNDFMLHYQAVNEEEYCKYVLPNDGSHNYESEFQYRWVHKSEEQVELLYAGAVQSSFGCSQSRYEAVFEYLPYRLAHLEELTIQNGLSILWKTLIGYRKLHGAYGWFDISERMISFNKKHEIRVWLNQNIHFNQPDQNRKSVSLKSQTQSEMISRLFCLVNERKGKSGIWDAFNAAKSQVTFFRFQQAIDMLEEFANIQNIRLKHFIVNPFNKPHLNQQIIQSRDSDRSRSENLKLLKLLQSVIPEDLSEKTFEMESLNGKSNADRNSGFIQLGKKQLTQSAVHPVIGMRKIEVKPRVALPPETPPTAQFNPLRITCNSGASFSPTTQTIQPLKLQPDKNQCKQEVSIGKIIEFDAKKQQRFKSRENQSLQVRPQINPQTNLDPYRIKIISPKAESSIMHEGNSELDNCLIFNPNSHPIQMPASLSAEKVPLAFPYAMLPKQFPYLPKEQHKKEGVQFRKSSLSSLLEVTQKSKQQFSKIRERLQFQSLPKQQQLFSNPHLKPQQKAQASLAEKDETPIRYFLPQRSQPIDSQLTSSFCGSSSLRNSLISMEVQEEFNSELTHSISSVDVRAQTQGSEADSRQIPQDKKLMHKRNNYLPTETNPIAEVENDDESESFYQTGGNSFHYSSLLKESVEKAENSQEGIRTSQLQQPQQIPSLPALGADLELQYSQQQQQYKQKDEFQHKEQCDESIQTVPQQKISQAQQKISQAQQKISQEIKIVPTEQKVSSKQLKVNPLRSQLLSYRDLSNLLASGMTS